MAEDDFDIKEPTEYSYNKDEVYSHSQLVMSALKECKEKRAKEMRDGYKTTKFDRMGNAFPVVVPDSMKEFIESVESLMMIQERDYDDEAMKKIKVILEQLNNKHKEFCEKEKKEWETMHPLMKQDLQKRGFYYREGYLCIKLDWDDIYKRYKVDKYTKIVSEIQKLIKRMGDYKEEIYEA